MEGMPERIISIEGRRNVLNMMVVRNKRLGSFIGPPENRECVWVLSDNIGRYAIH
jgi:hypothetical protein